MAQLHADEANIDTGLVRRLLRAQFPQWMNLPIERLESGGTVNAIYRLGDDLTVRLPRTAGGAQDLEREVRWLPRLLPVLPVPIPAMVATGEPAEGYPWPWAVLRWIEGETPVEGDIAEPELVARNLAAFVRAMRGVSFGGGPVAHRGAPLASIDQEFRVALEALRHTDEPFDAEAAIAVWHEACAARSWSATPHATSSRRGTCCRRTLAGYSGMPWTSTTQLGSEDVVGHWPWPSSNCRTTARPTRSSRPTPATHFGRCSPPLDSVAHSSGWLFACPAAPPGA